MKLQTIGACAAVLEAKGLLKNRVTEETAKRAVLQLSCYSREVREGTLFLCKELPFTKNISRRRFCGAPLPMSANRNILRAARYRVCWWDIRSAMAALAEAFYDYPADRLRIIGVTGTKERPQRSITYGRFWTPGCPCREKSRRHC